MRGRWGVPRGQRGATLLESTLALGLLAMVVVGGMRALTSSQTSAGAVFRQAVAENLARNQMEYVLSLPYQTPPSTYPLDPSLTLSPGWAVTAEGRLVSGADARLEEIRVAVSLQGKVQTVLVTRRVQW